MENEAKLPPGEYLLHALKLIRERSLKRTTIDWTATNEEFTERAKQVTTITEAQAYIKELLKSLGDNHSFLLTREEAAQNSRPHSAGWRLHWQEPTVIDVLPHSPASQHDVKPGDRILEINGQPVSADNWHEHFRPALAAGIPIKLQKHDGAIVDLSLSKGFTQTNPLPTSRLTAAGYGLLDLPGHMGDGTLPDDREYGELLKTAFAELEDGGTEGWVIDLRRCDGGNMWPILAGLTPLLGTGTYGSFVDPTDNIWWEWGFNGSELTSTRRDDPKEQFSMDKVPDWRPLRHMDAPVAVLTSRVTSSSGEAVAISFKGRPRTRLIGESTGGLTSANNLHTLPDGAWLLLAETYEADRLDWIYEAGIQPDQEISTDWRLISQDNDPVITAAEQWLRTQAEAKS